MLNRTTGKKTENKGEEGELGRKDQGQIPPWHGLPREVARSHSATLNKHKFSLI